ncbi:hypothetical protein [Bacillus nitratireducens]|uniref:hypothetical protein n=1 Tax=Bacillus nitratireducens TaxID=2026193 RepID=UPI002E7A1781|nr:hypothetical protein [Bacillus nitratireducens]
MAVLKDEHLALSSGIGLAGLAIGYFYEAGRNAFENFRKELAQTQNVVAILQN